jgi:3-oxo-5-alpha-steroid 4-dehydrogenase 1
MAGMAVMAVIVFIALFFFKAGYGYLSTSKWGPKISNKVAWVLMEAPAFLFLLYYTLRFAFSGIDTGNNKIVLYVMAGLFLLHYFQRSFIFPLLMRGKSTMPIAVMLMGLVFNTLNAYMIGGWLYGEAPAGMYELSWFWSPQFIIGLIVFFTGMGINLHSDHVIRNLRKPGDTKHYIPRKGFYKYVTSANYFGEFTEWIGYAILTWSPAGVLFAVWTFANLGPRAKSLTEKYEQEFGEEYKKLNKKHIIPYIW